MEVRELTEQLLKEMLRRDKERAKRLEEKLRKEARERYPSFYGRSWDKAAADLVGAFHSKNELIINENSWILPHPRRQWNETNIVKLIKRICCEKLSSLGYKTALEGSVIKHIGKWILISRIYMDVVGINESKHTIGIEIVKHSPSSWEGLKQRARKYRDFLEGKVAIAFKKGNKKLDKPTRIMLLLTYFDEVWKVDINSKSVEIISRRFN